MTVCWNERRGLGGTPRLFQDWKRHKRAHNGFIFGYFLLVSVSGCFLQVVYGTLWAAKMAIKLLSIIQPLLP